MNYLFYTFLLVVGLNFGCQHFDLAKHDEHEKLMSRLDGLEKKSTTEESKSYSELKALCRSLFEITYGNEVERDSIDLEMKELQSCLNAAEREKGEIEEEIKCLEEKKIEIQKNFLEHEVEKKEQEVKIEIKIQYKQNRIQAILIEKNELLIRVAELYKENYKKSVNELKKKKIIAEIKGISKTVRDSEFHQLLENVFERDIESPAQGSFVAKIRAKVNEAHTV